MNKAKVVFLAIFLVLAILPVSGCENYTESEEINGLMKTNDLHLSMKAGGDSGGFSLEKVYGSDTDYYLKIDVTDTCSFRGETDIKSGDRYKLYFTLKNTDADPVINYSFWKKPKTSLRYFTFNGENGNPPSAGTQEPCAEWKTFEETFETLEGEDSFLLTLHSGQGTFYIREIGIERIQ